jgi:hypothetical protein
MNGNTTAKYVIAIILLTLAWVLFMFSVGSQWQWRAIIVACIGFVDFLYQNIFPSWWHWGRWADQFSEEISEEVVEFVGFFLLGGSGLFLAISLTV